VFEKITLGLNGDTNLIQSRLYNHPECVFPITVFKEPGTEAVTYIKCEPADDVMMLDRYLSVVAEYVIERYETGMLRRILERSYKELSAMDKREILQSRECFSDDPAIGYQARKQAILLSLYDYLREDSVMLLEGFITFRLKDYEKLLECLAERLVEQYIAHKEYGEFISLLRYFVTIQEPRPKLVHVVVCPEGGYMIADEQGTDITARCYADFVEQEALLTEEAYDDLLISVLITLAPEAIQVHNRSAIRNPELFSTIFQVFGGRISYCDACPLCKTI